MCVIVNDGCQLPSTTLCLEFQKALETCSLSTAEKLLQTSSTLRRWFETSYFRVSESGFCSLSQAPTLRLLLAEAKIQDVPAQTLYQHFFDTAAKNQLPALSRCTCRCLLSTLPFAQSLQQAQFLQTLARILLQALSLSLNLYCEIAAQIQWHYQQHFAPRSGSQELKSLSREVSRRFDQLFLQEAPFRDTSQLDEVTGIQLTAQTFLDCALSTAELPFALEKLALHRLLESEAITCQCFQLIQQDSSSRFFSALVTLAVRSSEFSDATQERTAKLAALLIQQYLLSIPPNAHGASPSLFMMFIRALVMHPQTTGAQKTVGTLLLTLLHWLLKQKQFEVLEACCSLLEDAEKPTQLFLDHKSRQAFVSQILFQQLSSPDVSILEELFDRLQYFSCTPVVAIESSRWEALLQHAARSQHAAQLHACLEFLYARLASTTVPMQPKTFTDTNVQLRHEFFKHSTHPLLKVAEHRRIFFQHPAIRQLAEAKLLDADAITTILGRDDTTWFQKRMYF